MPASEEKRGRWWKTPGSAEAMGTKKARMEGTKARINYNYLVGQGSETEMGEDGGVQLVEVGGRNRRRVKYAEKVIIPEQTVSTGQWSREICHGYVLYTLCMFSRFPLQLAQFLFDWIALSSNHLTVSISVPTRRVPLAPTGRLYPFLASLYVTRASSRPI